MQKRGQGNIFGTINFGNDTLNPLDTGFGFANAALGIFSSYSQLSRWGEGAYTAINHEAFVQDNWKVTSRLTLDFGMRFVHQVPNYDGYYNDSNFFPDQWTASNAPRLYVFGCDTNVNPCAAANRRAMDPATRQFVGTATQASIIVGTLVPNVGDPANGLILAGQGIAKTGFTYPALGYAPRFGGAWDVKGTGQFIVRGATGLFFDRPPVNSIYGTTSNPPKSQNVTVRYGNLQDISTAGLTTVAPPAITVFEYDNRLPTSFQWNIGTQMLMPFASAARRVVYRPAQLRHAEHAESQQHRSRYGVPAAVPGSHARAERGRDLAGQHERESGSLLHRLRQHHAEPAERIPDLSLDPGVVEPPDEGPLLLRLQRHDQPVRPAAGRGPSPAQRGRLDHRLERIRRTADDLLGNNHPQTHIMRANFVWQLPTITSSQAGLKALGLIVNDWNLAGIWSGATGAPYSVNLNYVSGGGNAANVALTGSPDFAPRAVIVGDPGSGCSSEPVQAVRHGDVPGPPRRQRRPGFGHRLPERVLHQLRSTCRSRGSSG